MQIAYLHVVVNHLPIMAVPVLAGVLALGLWTRSAAVQRAALLGFVAVGLVTVVVFVTGKGAEDFAEHLPKVLDHDLIEAHEAAATVAFAIVSVLALAAVLVFARGGGLAWLARRTPDAAPVRGGGLVLLLALVASAALGVTGKLGGRIAHDEFRTDAVHGDQAEDAADAAADAVDDARDAAEDAAEDARKAAEDAAEDARDAAEDAADDAADEAEDARRDRNRGRH